MGCDNFLLQSVLVSSYTHGIGSDGAFGLCGWGFLSMSISPNYSRLHLAGQFNLAVRLAAAERASREAIYPLLIEAGRAKGRRDWQAFADLAIEISQHYANAAEPAMAAYWRSLHHSYKAEVAQ